MSRRLLLLLLVALGLGACNATSPYVSTVGVLKAGTTLTVRIAGAPLDVFAPEARQRPDLFTVAATALPKGAVPPPPVLRPAAHGLLVTAPNPLAALLVRVPDKVNLVVDSQRGDVSVTDITGNARIVASDGNVMLMLPGYAQAAVGRGNLLVTMGAGDWPGTLHFSTQNGDVQLRVRATVGFTVHLHTDDGALFTDFGLRGVSSGRSETIDGSVNGGGARRIDVETGSGGVQLLRLQPQP
ncbi:MAG TPA: hypothetical protein VKR56_12695 [Candidatus Cybelea sp.]|nr:hypothetical protein [Candidatus Cybelea sp.]